MNDTISPGAISADPVSTLPPFDAPYAEDDVAIARRLFDMEPLWATDRAAVNREARRLIDRIRQRGMAMLGIEQVMREYSLSTREGLALMVLAEALLRVPDAATVDELIKDKLGAGGFEQRNTQSDSALLRASHLALHFAARVVEPNETPEHILGQLVKRVGVPVVRAAAKRAVRILGDHFVVGQTMEGALSRACGDPRYRYSFDMLGEGARTALQARRYADSYANAIHTIGQQAGGQALPDRPGISVKLSALHPRYEALAADRVMRELVPVVIELAREARKYDLNFTIDAEEAARLELSLAVIARVFADPGLAGWDGFGAAVQGYQKRALNVVGWLGELAALHSRRMMVRLVKGAYWDTEIKRAQERGLADYPVFTRKPMTDLNYIACAHRLLAREPLLYPQFATHNALTVATIIDIAGSERDFEFQRLHGMGEALYDAVLEKHERIACRVYAPVGEYRELLAYLVRRLLENGANTSFVVAAGDPDVEVATLLRTPVEVLRSPDQARHSRIARPLELFAPERRNSAGIEFGHAASVSALLREAAAARSCSYTAMPLIDGARIERASHPVVSPIDAETVVGLASDALEEDADHAVSAAKRGFVSWNATPADQRAACLERAATLLEAERGRFIHLLQKEGGKTLEDAIAEVREAVDFCRYYAVEGRKLFNGDLRLPGPTGEVNSLRLRGRGVFVAISPWNFPLAIFLGQVAAALMAGNSIVAKPAEQTPLIAAEAMQLLQRAGVPAAAAHLLPGDGALGARLVAHTDVAGVVFTGSTAVARWINRALAANNGPIVPLIAETGGINAMIVDSTALPEQVADDVTTSAFRSAGQRCSALRLLCVQEDVAEHVLGMIIGAARELEIGDPTHPSVQVGPIIDAEAKTKLLQYIAAVPAGQVLYAGNAPHQGTFVAPHIIGLPQASALNEEIFGPILHVVRYKADGLEDVLAAIQRTRYGLTLGVQSRIDETVRRIVACLSTGNVYVNRNMIGAVVGVQPFGGSGLSGTGPKAGGPHYLLRFATEQTLTVNTSAAGGNVTLATLDDES